MINSHNVTNEEWYGTTLDKCPENSEAVCICNMLFYDRGGFVRVMQRRKQETIVKAYHARYMQSPNDVANVLGNHRFGRNNLYMSVATYMSEDKGTQNNIQTLNAICIDVDYTNSKDEQIASLSADEAAKLLYGKVIVDTNSPIPAPTYIECGRNVRLVYVFDSPFIVPKNNKQRTAIFNLFKRIGKIIGQNIMSVGDWNVDNFKVAPYVRVPESINKQWEKSYSSENVNWSLVNTYFVHINQDTFSGILYDFTELCESVLPALPDWYSSWKAKPKRKKKCCGVSIKTLSLSRLDDLEALQRMGYDIGYRETMTYLYRLFSFQSGMSEEEALKAALSFNRKFKNPLRDGTVVVEAKPSDYTIKYTNRTLREMFGLSEKSKFFSSQAKTRHEYYEAQKKRDIQTGKLVPKKEKLQSTYAEILSLKEKGYKNKEIESILFIPHSTLQRYLKEIKNEKVWD